MRYRIAYRLVLVVMAAGYLCFMVASPFDQRWSVVLVAVGFLLFVAQLLRLSVRHRRGWVDRPTRRGLITPTVLLFVALAGAAIVEGLIGNASFDFGVAALVLGMWASLVEAPTRAEPATS